MQKTLTRFLAWFSLVLGLPQLLAPGRVNEAIGVKDDDDTRLWQRIVGAQELSAFAGVMTAPRIFLWTRVAGDVFHLGLLARAWQTKKKDQTRLTVAIAQVGTTFGLDLFTAIAQARNRPKAKTVVAMTISRPRDEVRNAWQSATFEHVAGVSYTDAPGNRGTEVRIELESSRHKPQAKDELRRFKQQLETGTVPASDGTPEGQSTKRLFKQRPAQPVKSS